MDDQIDKEYRQLIEVMQAEAQAEQLLHAMQKLFDAEKLPRGADKRAFVSAQLCHLMMSMPAVWESVIDGNPNLANDQERAGAVGLSLGLLFGLIGESKGGQP
jgi:hypothetical protein